MSWNCDCGQINDDDILRCVCGLEVHNKIEISKSQIISIEEQDIKCFNYMKYSLVATFILALSAVLMPKSFGLIRLLPVVIHYVTFIAYLVFLIKFLKKMGKNVILWALITFFLYFAGMVISYLYAQTIARKAQMDI